MKLLLTLFILFPGVCVSQNIFATFKEACGVWSDHTHNGKKLTQVDRGDSCILIEFIPMVTGSDWCKVAVLDTIGFVMVNFLKIDRTDLQTLRTTDFHRSRESAARMYIRYNWENLKSFKLAKSKQREDSAKAAQKAWDDQIKAMRKELAKVGLILNSQSVSNNVLGYPDFQVSVMNCSNKTIKYIWYNITLFNPVNDVVKSCTLKGVGPIYAYKSADFNFETVAISKVVDYSKIKSIKIQYMDREIVTYTGAQILSNTRLGNQIIDKYVSLLKY
jgi:hypothetical protein